MEHEKNIIIFGGVEWEITGFAVDKANKREYNVRKEKNTAYITVYFKEKTYER